MAGNDQPSGRTRRPTILVIAPQPFFEDRGTPIGVAHLLRALTHHGYAVDLLTFPTGRGLPIQGVRVNLVGNPLGFRKIPIGFSWKKLFLDCLLWFAMRKLLKTRRYAAVHAVEEAAFLAVFSRREGVPVVYDMQSSMPDQLAHRRLFGWRPVMSVLKRCESWLLNRVDRVVCSAGLADHVKTVAPRVPVDAWCYPPQSVVQHDGVSDLRSELVLSDNAPVVVYAGTFERYQGLHELLHAMPAVLDAVPATRFVLVGADAQSMAVVNRRAAALNITHGVRILERQQRERIAMFLAMADVLVIPRAYGMNVPLKLFDYYGAGKPIVASGKAVHSLAQTPRRLVRVNHSPHELAAGLIKVLQNRDGAFRIPSRARLSRETERRNAAFLRLVDDVFRDVTMRDGPPVVSTSRQPTRVSVIIPTHNEQHGIAATVAAVRAQARPGLEVQIIVADDGSSDETVGEARRAGAEVVFSLSRGGNPGAARNAGAAAATGDPIVFLDADCVPEPGWLDALLDAHARGASVVGGSLAAAPHLPLLARCDYVTSAYLTNPLRPAGQVPNHPPANLSVRRHAFMSTSGFTRQAPVCDGHEELAWQAELKRRGVGIYFAPRAVVQHRNRNGMVNLIKRNYRWAYSAIESKSQSGNARFAALYHHPYLLMIGIVPLAILQSMYIAGCWLRVRRYEVVLMLPLLMLARLAYGFGLCVGGLQWMRTRYLPVVPDSLPAQ